MAAEEDRIGRKVAAGAAWVLVTRLTLRSVGLVSTVILARLLLPLDFGIVALAASVAGTIEAMGNLSIETALIVIRKDDRRHYDTAWTLALLQSAFLALVITGVAVPAANLLNDPRLAPVIWVLAATTLLEGFKNIAVIDFQKYLNFSRDMQLSLSGKLISFVVTIPLAWYWQSYLALVAGIVIGRAATVLFSYLMHPYRPRLCLAEWRSLLGISNWLLLSNMLELLVKRLDLFIIGHFYGVRLVGLYDVSREVATLPTSDLVGPIRRALFSGMARVAATESVLRELYLNTFSASTAVGVPAAVGIVMLAEPIVRTMLGQRWLDAIPVLAILSIYGLVRAASIGPRSLLIAVGRTRRATGLQAAYAAVLVPLLLWGTAYYGVSGAAWALVAAALANLCQALWIVSRTLELPLILLLARTWRSLAAAAIMAAALAALMTGGLAATNAIGAAIALIVFAPAGAVIYLLSHLALWRLTGSPDGIERQVMEFLVRAILRRR